MSRLGVILPKVRPGDKIKMSYRSRSGQLVYTKIADINVVTKGDAKFKPLPPEMCRCFEVEELL